jgi:ABC-2 type transport system ATP-binding protein
LRGVNGGHATYDHQRGKVIVPASHGVDTLREALHRLDTAGIRPGDIGLHKPTLDDVFLHLTSQPKKRAVL